jgi:hypothetical protein
MVRLIHTMSKNLRRWKKWIYSSHEETGLTQKPWEREFSVLLWLSGWLFWLSRRLSLIEHIKHVVPCLHPHLRTPAWFIDLYVMASWVVLVGFTYASHGPHEKCSIFVAIAVFWAAQIILTSLYHNIWRRMIFRDRHPMGKTYNPIRNCIIGLGNFAALCWLFGLAYWWSGPNAFKEISSVSDAIYHAFVVGATVGYGDISPKLDNGWAQLLVVTQIAMSVCMLAVIIAQAVAAVGSLKSYDEKEHRARANREAAVVYQEFLDKNPEERAAMEVWESAPLSDEIEPRKP